MASINGISIKGIKKFFGHEGEPLYQGNLYLNNKKIAFWSQDSHGGMDNFMFDGGYEQERHLNDIIKAMNPEKAFHGGTLEKPFVIEYDLEQLITDYLDLANDEKTFKKAIKNGYDGIMVATDGYHETIWMLPKSYTVFSDDVLMDKFKDALDRVKASFFPEDEFRKHTVKVYRSLDDFIVGETINLKDKSVDELIANAPKTDSQNSVYQNSNQIGIKNMSVVDNADIELS